MTSELLARLALGSLGAWALVALVGRSLLQKRRTGNAGWRGPHGEPGSAAWWAAILIGLAALGLVVAPTLAAFGPAVEVGWLRIGTGAAAYVAGFVVVIWSQLAMGDSWRIGVQRGEHTTLRTSGPFAWCRNPIFTGMLLVTGGIAVWVPWATLAWLALAIALQLQVRVVEEPHLREVHGEDYRRYAARTGRFWPGIGRIR